jgi:hypothetical protein
MIGNRGESSLRPGPAIVITIFAGAGWAGVASGQCVVTCPPEASMEGEPCGDDANYGCCCAEPPAFEPITCGETVCGTVWADGSLRDTDWYEVVTAEPMILTWTVEAAFPVVTGLVETASPGSGDCSDMTGHLEPFALGEPCEVVNVATYSLPAGTYWFHVANQDFFDYPCGVDSDYVATLTGTPPCPADLNGDATVNVEDFLFLLAAWGGPGGDVDGDGTTNVNDFLELLAQWGPCPKK